MKKLPLSGDEEAFILARNKYLGLMQRYGMQQFHDELMSTKKDQLQTSNAHFKYQETNNIGGTPPGLQEFHSARDDFINKGSDLLRSSTMNNLDELGKNLASTREITTEQHNNFAATQNAAYTGSQTGTNAPSAPAPQLTPGATAAAQKTARQNAQAAKAGYEGALSESSATLPQLRAMLEQNNTKFRQLPNGNNTAALDEMDAAENRLLGSSDNASLKQVQQKRREYMSSSMASTRTAARHDHVAGIFPFQLADKKKSVFSERSQGIIRNYFDGLRDFNPAKKIIMARRKAIATKEATAAQEFLADMEAKRNPTVDNARDATQGMNEAANAVRIQDATAAAQLAGLAKATSEAIQAEDALEVGGAPARTEQEQTEGKTQDLYAELQKNDKKEIIYNTASGQHRITFDKASGTLSSKNPEALAKFVASTGDPDFKITHGSAEAGLNLLHHLVKEGVQDVSMTPDMRAKIKTAGGEDLIRIAEARGETFRSTSAVEQGERSLNALTFMRMTGPEDASARKHFNREFCTNEDRKDMLGILKQQLDEGKITKEQFAQEAKNILSPVNEASRNELLGELNLTPEVLAATVQAIGTTVTAPPPQPVAEEEEADEEEEAEAEENEEEESEASEEEELEAEENEEEVSEASEEEELEAEENEEEESEASAEEEAEPVKEEPKPNEEEQAEAETGETPQPEEGKPAAAEETPETPAAVTAEAGETPSQAGTGTAEGGTGTAGQEEKAQPAPTPINEPPPELGAAALGQGFESPVPVPGAAKQEPKPEPEEKPASTPPAEGATGETPKPTPKPAPEPQPAATAEGAITKPPEPTPPQQPTPTDQAATDEPPKPSKPLPETPAESPTPTAQASAGETPRPSKPLPQPPAEPAQTGQPQPQTQAQSNITMGSGRPSWTRMGMGKTREALKDAKPTDDISQSLAATVNNDMTAKNFNDSQKTQYLSGVKNTLNNKAENNTKTTYTNTAAELAVQNPNNVPAIIPTVTQKEAGQVVNKIAENDNNEKAQNALQQFMASCKAWFDKKMKSPFKKEAKPDSDKGTHGDEEEEGHEKHRDKKSKHGEKRTEKADQDNSEASSFKDKLKDGIDKIKQKIEEVKQKMSGDDKPQTPSPSGGGKE